MIINKVVNSNLCNGCGICVSLYKNQVIMNYEGFFNRPKQIQELSDKEIDDFKYICPGIYQSSLNVSTLFKHDIWGNYYYSGKGYSLNNEIRYKSSSGGILTQTAIYLLENNIVSGIVHIGYDPLNPLENIIKVSKTKNEVINNAGSRYSPASPLVSIIEIIESNLNEKFAFIGKPCDVTALRQAQNYYEKLKIQIPIILSFFCAGTPSRKGVNNILSHVKIDRKNVKKIQYRGNGWPGLTTIETSDGIFKMKYEESWGKYLGPTVQNRCKICADGIGENADIVSADVWELDENGIPNFEEKEGVGLVLARSKIGYDIILEMMKYNVIHSEKFNLDKLYKIQTFQYVRKCTIFPRILARKIFFKKNPIYPNQRIFKNLKYVNIWELLKIFGGSILRVIAGKL